MRKVIGILGICMSGLLYGQGVSVVESLKNTTVCPWEDALFTIAIISMNSDEQAFNWANSNLRELATAGEEHIDFHGMSISPISHNLTSMIMTFNLRVPSITFPFYDGSLFSLFIFNFTFDNIDRSDRQFDFSAYLNYFNTRNGTLTENHQTSNQTTHINWQPLPFLNSSNIRYSLTINDLTTEMPVDCDDCRFIADPYYSFTPNNTLAGHELDYTVSFDYCLREEVDEDVELLFHPVNLKALSTHENIFLKWNSFFTQFGVLEVNDVFYNVQVTDKNDSSLSNQDQVSGYTYTFTPKPEKVCSTFNFEVKAADSPYANITGKTITAALTDLGEPEISVSQQDDQQVLVQLTSPAPLHRITLTNSTDQIADVVTSEKQHRFSVAQTEQTILVSVSPENCPGMSVAATLFVTEAPSTELPSMESNAASGVYQGMIMAAVTASSLLLTQWLNRP